MSQTVTDGLNRDFDLAARGRIATAVSIKGGWTAQDHATKLFILSSPTSEVFADYIRILKTGDPKAETSFLRSIFRQNQEHIKVVY